MAPTASSNDAGNTTYTGTASKSSARKVVFGAAMGHFLEWYDYGIYGFLAVPIAANFFHSGNATAAMLSTFAVFAVPFIARPFGGIFIGWLSDRIGRQKVLVGVLLGISAATVLIGLLPSYHAIGVIAPILLILFRLIQGISAGGEVTNAMTFVAEHAPPGRRALYMSWVQSGSFVALLVGNLAGLLLAFFLDEASLIEWGWRIPFLVAAPLALVGWQVRRKLDESPAYKAMQAELKEEASAEGTTRPHPLRESLAQPEVRRAIVLAALLALLNSSGYYALLTYMPTYLQTELGHDELTSFTATAIAVLVLLILVPLSAMISDRVGRKPTMIIASIAMAVVAVPSYLLVRGGIGPMILGLVLLAASFAVYTGTIHPALAELFPTRVRATAYSIGYNISTAIFGGAAPLLLVWLIDLTGSNLVPAVYMIVTAVGTLVAAICIKESHRKSTIEEELHHD